jgi:hypothetical protein
MVSFIIFRAAWSDIFFVPKEYASFNLNKEFVSPNS